jgi:hypothetical protein
MTLPRKWVDEIFARLSVRYGKAFMNRWDGVDIELVKADWAEELSGFQNWPEAIKYAFDHMDTEKPPTVAVFRDLARKAPPKQVPALEAPTVNPEVMTQAVTQIKSASQVKKVDPKQWAHKILDRYKAGEKLNPTTLRFAKEALGYK